MRTAKNDRGSTSVLTVVVLTPMLVLLLGFVSFAGRASAARHDINTVARDAARAASQRNNPDVAAAAAETTAQQALQERNITCAQLHVVTGYQPLAAGEMVTVTVSCAIALSDLAGMGLPGQRLVVATGYEPLDRYRGTGP